MYIIEGCNLIEEAVSEGAFIEKAVIRQTSTAVPDRIIEKLGSRVVMADDRIFTDIAQTETSQGIIAAVKKPNMTADKIPGKSMSGNFVVLDRLQDPGNIGTVIRTADAAGYGLVIALKGTADVFSPKTVRAAAGSLFRMPVLFIETETELIRFIRAAGKKIVAASPAGSRKYYEEDLSRNIALIVGNEGNGVSPLLIENADLKINIPMEGNIESLNASVAAAIIMYEKVRTECTR